MKGINLGFVISLDGSQWTGGLEYYVNLVQAIKLSDTSGRIKITGLVTPGLDTKQVQRFQELFDETLFMPKSTVIQKAYEYIRNSRLSSLVLPFVKSPVEKVNPSSKMDVIFAPFDMVEYIHIPTITWLADFQHVFFPEFFTGNDIANRNYIFSRASASAKVILLSSDTAFGDFKKLFPENASKVEVLRFVAHAPIDAYKLDVPGIVKKYNLPDKFYYLPNQFWMHKNHQIVLDALEICVKEFPEICVVSTGNLYEYRDLTFPSRFMAEVSKKGLRNNFIVLGLIDRMDVYGLLRHCLAVLQPSLFEGWSTTVEEAKSLGKTLILSDIPVHREQDPLHGFFFDPLDPHNLAHLLIEQWSRLTPGVNIVVEKASKLTIAERMKDYGDKFIKCLDLSLR